MHARFLILMIAAAACSADITAPNRARGTYSVFTVDGRMIPIVSSQDSACEAINSGGWVSLEADGHYQMELDRTTIVCDGVAGSSSAIAQGGTYTWTSDSLLTFQPTPPQGPPFTARFDPGTSQSGEGRVPNLQFDFVGHSYWLLEDAPR